MFTRTAIAAPAIVFAGCFAQLHPTTRADANLATAPDFSLPSSTGRNVTLADALSHGPAVLVFYRGYW